MVANKIKGLWVPLEILHSEELSSTQKLVMAVVIGLSKDGQCTASNQYIADAIGVSYELVKKIIPQLATKGYLRTKNYRDKKKMIRRVIYT